MGCGIKAIRDPALTREFSADWRPIDLSAPHAYAVDWSAGRVEYFLDGESIRTTEQAPDYPMQLIIGVFDFPDGAEPMGNDPEVPALLVQRVVGHPLTNQPPRDSSYSPMAATLDAEADSGSKT